MMNMVKNHKNKTLLENMKYKKLLKGKFYSVNKHPGCIVYKNDKKNKYIAVVTGTSGGRHTTKLKHSTEKNIKNSYVNNRPVVGKRRNFGSKELVGMKFHREDKAIIKVISRRKPKKLKYKKEAHMSSTRELLLKSIVLKHLFK